VHIKILGGGCANCHALEANAREAVAALDIQAEIEAVTDFGLIAGYGVMNTPALVVDEQVVMSGRVPTADQVADLLKSH